MILLKSMAQKVFSDAVAVQLLFRVDVHDIVHEGQVAEGDPRFQGVYGDAAVGPQHVVHMELPDPFFRLLLEGFRVRREIRVFIAEDLVRDLPGEEDPDVGVFMDPPAHQVHADGSADGGDVVGSQSRNDRLQGTDHIVPADDDLVMIAVDIVRNLAGVF